MDSRNISKRTDTRDRHQKRDSISTEPCESLKPAARTPDLLSSNLKRNKLLLVLNVALMAVRNVIIT
jgi:hypothetical protein